MGRNEFFGSVLAMQTTIHSTSNRNIAQNSMPHFLRRQVQICCAIGIFIGLVFATIALSTWNVSDPSFSHKTAAAATNALGYPGAALSDLLMQFFGLASIIALTPALAWGISFFCGQLFDKKGSRLTAWFFGSVLAAAVMGLFPRPETWPLPTGLGGVLGDMLLKLPATIIGDFPTGILAFILGALLALPAVWLLLKASGLVQRQTVTESDIVEEPIPWADDDEENEKEGSLILGVITHIALTTQARLRRLFGLNTRKNADDWEYEAPYDMNHGSIDDGLDVGSMDDQDFHRQTRQIHADSSYNQEPLAPLSRVAPRQEPQFDANPARQEPPMDDSYYQEQEPAYQPVERVSSQTAAAQQLSAQQNAQRVTQAAPPPRQGKRVIKEAQSSLLTTSDFELPSIHLLAEPKNIVRDPTLSPEALEQNARMLEGVLEDFGVKGEIIHVRPGPVVTLYELEPAPGIKSSRVIGLADDIARSMSAIAARVAVVPGRNAIGIELPNQSRETVYFREMIASRDFEANKGKLPLSLGKTIGGEAVFSDLAKMPHVLVAGTTGSGKSVAINTMILSILYRFNPSQCRLIMIDPKMLELSVYDGIPHLLTPVVTDPKKAVVALKWTVREMEDRYKKMSKLGVRNIDGFNQRAEEARAKGEAITRTVQTGFDKETGEAVYETEEFDLEPIPYIVVIIDEMADLMMVAGKDIEGAVQRLAQMARAAGIHVIMATQRPSVDVITGTIKANFPTRISFQVTSKIDSRTILGEQGAEQLLGMGDMLFMAGGGRIQRVHGPFVSDVEVEAVVDHLKTQGVPQYLDAITVDDDDEGSSDGGPSDTSNLSESDDPYDQAVAVVLRDGKASTSYIQRRLGIGYNRAASLIERMEEEGVIGPANHAGKREILVPTEKDILGD
jgi:S-DNA-T family DNA segregation ATPase FtsK/SpoIIIE